MKKNLVYFLVPLVGLLVFGFFFWRFNDTYEAKEAAKKAAVKKAREDKLADEARNREKAIKDALAAQERRKAEKAAKEAKEKKDQEERQAAIEARNKANRDQLKLKDQADRLERDIKAEKEAIAKIAEDNKRIVDEQAFLKTYVKQAEANAKSLTEVLDKIAAADAARAAADAAAAAKAKNNS